MVKGSKVVLPVRNALVDGDRDVLKDGRPFKAMRKLGLGWEQNLRHSFLHGSRLGAPQLLMHAQVVRATVV